MRKRNKILNIRLTEDELRSVKAMQAATNLNMRDFIWECLKKKPMVIKPNGDKIVIQLKYIGNNLNQLTRKVNSGQIRDCSTELEKIYKKIEEMEEEWQ